MQVLIHGFPAVIVNFICIVGKKVLYDLHKLLEEICIYENVF